MLHLHGSINKYTAIGLAIKIKTDFCIFPDWTFKLSAPDAADYAYIRSHRGCFNLYCKTYSSVFIDAAM